MDHEAYMREAAALGREALADGDAGGLRYRGPGRPDHRPGPEPAGGRRRRHRPRRGGGHPGRLPEGGFLAAAWRVAVCHPGALPHVRGSDHQRPRRRRLLRGEGR